jgi:signal transduction histidine kinase
MSSAPTGPIGISTQSAADGTPARPSFDTTGILAALLEISNTVGSDLSLDSILDRIVRITARVMDVRTSSIYLWNEDRSRLILRSNVGFHSDLIGKAGFAAGKGIPGWVAQHGEIVALADATEDPRYDPLPTTREHNFHAYVCAPLRIHDEVIGVMTARKEASVEFAPDELTVFQTICKQVAIVIQKARMETRRIEAEKLAAVAVSLSGIAHYIKNLLLAMRGGEYIIDAGLKHGDLDHIREGWGVTRRQARKIGDLVETMLQYHRDRELEPVPVEMNALILDILTSLEDRALQLGVELVPDLDLRLDRIEVDLDAIHDILINLIDNAMEAVPPGRKGLVKIQTRLLEDKGRARIAIYDNGAGIRAEDQPKVFNLFYSTKGDKGTGIGLAATRKLIMEHGGTIDFVTCPGEGTEFFMLLPLRQNRA